MSATETQAEEQDRMLRALAGLELGLAETLKARSEAVQTTAEVQALALAFERVARGVRLTIALQSRLSRARLETGELARKARQTALARRRTHVQAVLDRDIDGSAGSAAGARDGRERERLHREVEARLDEDVAFERLLAGSVEDAVARIRADLGLAARGEAQAASDLSPSAVGEAAPLRSPLPALSAAPPPRPGAPHAAADRRSSA